MRERCGNAALFRQRVRWTSIFTHQEGSGGDGYFASRKSGATQRATAVSGPKRTSSASPVAPIRTNASKEAISSLGFIAAFLAVFVLTAPWRIAGQDVGRLSVPLAAAAALCLLALLHRPWRRALVGRFREGIGPVSGGGLFAAALVAAAFLARV